MKIRFFIVCFVCLISSLLAASAYALDEQLEFMDVSLPVNWEVVKAENNQAVFENRSQEATFIVKKIPVYNVSLENYARATMKAHAGFNFTKRTNSIYYFEHLYGYRNAWTLVEYYKGRRDMLITKTGIGESEDFVFIMDSIVLK